MVRAPHARVRRERSTFYRDVFGWTTEVASDSPEFRYTTLDVGDEQLAGVMDASGVPPRGCARGLVGVLPASPTPTSRCPRSWRSVVRCSWARRTRRTGVWPPPPTRPAPRSSSSADERRPPWRPSCSCPARVRTPWYWHLVAPDLEAAGSRRRGRRPPGHRRHRRASPSTPTCVVDAVGDRRDLVLVAQSLAGFIAPLVCERVPVDLMILVAAMVPQPGESGGEWWANTEHAEARGPDASDDPVEMFLHDVPDDVAARVGRTTCPRSRGGRSRRPVAARCVARRADPVPPVPRRPVLPGRVPAPGRARAPRDRARRDGRRSPAGAQPSPRARRNGSSGTTPSSSRRRSSVRAMTIAGGVAHRGRRAGHGRRARVLPRRPRPARHRRQDRGVPAGPGSGARAAAGRVPPVDRRPARELHRARPADHQRDQGSAGRAVPDGRATTSRSGSTTSTRCWRACAPPTSPS